MRREAESHKVGVRLGLASRAPRRARGQTLAMLQVLQERWDPTFSERVSPSKTGRWIELNSWWGLRSPLWTAARPEFELKVRAMCRPCAQRPARRSLVS